MTDPPSQGCWKRRGRRRGSRSAFEFRCEWLAATALEQVQHRGGSAAVVLAGRPVDGEVTHRGVRPETARRDAALGVRGGLTAVQRSFPGEAAPDLRNRRRIRVDRRADTVIIFSPARGARAADRRPRRAPARGGFWNVPRRP